MKKKIVYIIVLIICAVLFSVLYLRPKTIKEKIVCSDEEGRFVSVEFDYEYHRCIPESNSFCVGTVTVDGITYYSLKPHQRYKGMGCEFYSRVDNLIEADRVRIVGGFEEKADMLTVLVNIKGESNSYYYTR